MNEIRRFLESRKKENVNVFLEIANRVYESGSIKYIENFQDWLDNLNRLAKAGKLEETITGQSATKLEIKEEKSVQEQQTVQTIKQPYSEQNSRPKLNKEDYKKYVELRKQGKSIGEIKEEYDICHLMVLGGWERSYNRYCVEPSKVEAKIEEGNIKENAPIERTELVIKPKKKYSGEIVLDPNDTRPFLTNACYQNLRDQGFTEPQILKEYKVTNKYQINGFRTTYLVSKKKQKAGQTTNPSQ